MKKPTTRRQALVTSMKLATAFTPASFLIGCGEQNNTQTSLPTSSASIDLGQPLVGLDTRLTQELITSSKSASSNGQWTELQFNDFIDSMGEDSLKRTCKTFALSPTAVDNYISNPIMKKEIKQTIANASSSFLGGNLDKIAYHQQVVIPTARNMQLPTTIIDTYDTLSLERAVYSKVLEHNWTNLNENERITFLEQSQWNIDQKKLLSLAAVAGTGFLAALSTAVNITGFAFYTGMSSGLYAIASTMGIVLPFTVYTGASAAIALATGPVGWLAATVLAAAGIYGWMESNKETKETTMLRAVLHMHHYKVSSMQEANISFSLSGV